ncbi:GroES-like protein [Mycena indigotica]|uniref:GroES-like protein n=1 Tax=Mycena indigotica TaxID=2126181 RepID=A0A8H6SCI7_9AGAR|nr:GroES-like protein [Mycena indigotica]KAF7297036.1 GroES-like protein [Mycena indigotica]
MMANRTQKALVIPSAKAPIELRDIIVPTPGKGEVLIKIMAVGLNPMDPMRHMMDFLIPEYPAVLGSDIAGVIEELGQDVTAFHVGDEVFVQTLGDGYQEYVVLPTSILIRKPQNVTFDEVATMPITFTTSCVGLFAPAPLGLGLNPTFSFNKPQAGKSALVIGAGTSCGQFAIQLLKFAGFSTIVAYASEKHTDYLQSLGATLVIDRNATPLGDLAAFPALQGLAGTLDVVFDTALGLGPPKAEDAKPVDIAYDLVKSYGAVLTVNPRFVLSRSGKEGVQVMATLGWYAGPDIFPPKRPFPGYAATAEHTKFGKVMIQALPELLENRVIVGNRTEVLPDGLHGVNAGLTRWFSGAGVSGVKLIGRPQETIT